MPYLSGIQTVAETRAFQRQAADAGMSDVEVSDLIAYLSANPMAGNVIVGTGGCRKLRWAKSGKGKSGGVRAVTFYSGTNMPVFLISVFAKNVKDNLNQSERNSIGKVARMIADNYATNVVRVNRS